MEICQNAVKVLYSGILEVHQVLHELGADFQELANPFVLVDSLIVLLEQCHSAFNQVCPLVVFPDHFNKGAPDEGRIPNSRAKQ